MSSRAGGWSVGQQVCSLSRGWLLAGLATTLLGLIATATKAAEALPNYDEQAAGLSESLTKAAALYRDQKYDQMGKLVGEVERKLEELKSGENSERLASAIVPLERRLTAATELLKTAISGGPATGKKLAAKGTKPPVKTATRMPVKPNPNMPAKPAAASMAKNSTAAGLSYARDIGPLLLSKCGRCHTNDPKGGFCVISYAALMRGSDTGTVFKPGKGDGSTLIEILKSGDMPRGGGKLADEQIAMLTKWIDAGAPYDGDPVAAMADGGSSMPTGSETVSFMRDIAPVIVGSCTGCHGGQQGADNLEIETFAQIKRGGRSGDFLSAGNPSDSLLIKMLRGTAKDKGGMARPKMPRRGNALSEEVIKKFETWIAEGAKFDGSDQNAKLEYLLKVIAANNASHDELTKQRDASSGKTWALGNPGNTPVVVEADEYRIVGDLSPARMKEVTEEIRGIQTKVAAALKIPGEKPMYKGKLTLYLFNKRFEYSEFGQMVERRPLTEDLFGHSHYDVIDGYACVLANEDNKLNVPLLVAEGFATSYVETLARDVPRWYSIGMGRAVASRIEPRSPLLKQWDEQSLGGTTNLQAFLQAKELDSQGSAVAYRIVRNLMGRGSANQKLIDTMRKGAPFQSSFLQAYGMQPAMAAQAAMR